MVDSGDLACLKSDSEQCSIALFILSEVP